MPVAQHSMHNTAIPGTIGLPWRHVDPESFAHIASFGGLGLALARLIQRQAVTRLLPIAPAIAPTGIRSL